MACVGVLQPFTSFYLFFIPIPIPAWGLIAGISAVSRVQMRKRPPLICVLVRAVPSDRVGREWDLAERSPPQRSRLWRRRGSISPQDTISPSVEAYQSALGPTMAWDYDSVVTRRSVHQADFNPSPRQE